MPTIISNYANDIIEYKNNTIVEWWPALYIEKYYKQNSLDYNLISWWNKWEVFIFNNNWNDVWLIKYAPVINIEEKISDDYFIISTLLNEFDLNNTKKLNWIIFCDIQWYIRELNSSSRQLLNNLEWLENINFLKVADYEFQYLTNNLVLKYISNWWYIIVTTWSKWIVKIMGKGWEKIIKVPVWDFKDTIWAWDTFLACFAYYYYLTNDIKQAIEKASNYVYNFLIIKNNLWK